MLKDMTLVKRFDLVSTLDDFFYLSLTVHPNIVIWNSHLLTLGATPQQAYVDGIARLKPVTPSTAAFQDLPEAPNWDREKNDTVYCDGLRSLTEYWRARERVTL